MLASYPAKYRDKHGEVITTIENDGKILRMIVRGVEFRGSDFDALEPCVVSEDSSLSSFTVCRGCLCSCVIDCQMSVPIAYGKEIDFACLIVHLDLGDPRPNGGIDHEKLLLELQYAGRLSSSSGKRGGWFEDELAD